MTDLVKYLGSTLHRVYDAVVQRPMPWRMIDKLSSLEEAEEARADQSGQKEDTDPPSASGQPDPSDRLPPPGSPAGPTDSH
jgi:hypothetical protein